MEKVQKWEFKTVVGAYTGDAIDRKLSELGEEGWELIFVNRVTESGNFAYVFKRLKP